jgi:CheY-like chemotaxis protein
VDDAVAMFGSAAGDKGLELSADFTPAGRPLWLRGDSFRLRQVIANLVSNAIKFTANGSVVVRVVVQEPAGAASLIHLTVEDTGIGIAPEAHARIFEHFSQADGTTTRRFGGTGLGLTICKKLVALMGGNIRVDSAVGRGSTFCVELRLPVASTVTAAADVQPESVPAPPATAATALRGTVLLVEDNPVNQEVAAAMLSKLGLAAVLASDGQQAVELVRDQQFDLVLMDCQMPVMDGYDATAAIRRLPGGSGASLPVIALTANAMIGDEQKCLDSGMNDFLAKPFTLQQLQARLARWLPKARGLELPATE